MSGTVTRLTASESRGGRHWNVDVQYVDGPDSVASSGTIDFATGLSTKPGDSIQVQVTKLGPMRFERLGNASNIPGFGLWLFAVAIPITLICSVLNSVMVRARQKRLIRLGQPAIARVIRSGPRSFRIGSGYGVTYEFFLPDGHRRRGVIETGPKPDVQIGAGLLVLYDPEFPGQTMPYDDMAYSAGPTELPGQTGIGCDVV